MLYTVSSIVVIITIITYYYISFLILNMNWSNVWTELEFIIIFKKKPCNPQYSAIRSHRDTKNSLKSHKNNNKEVLPLNVSSSLNSIQLVICKD